jgi:hypothetical protein
MLILLGDISIYPQYLFMKKARIILSTIVLLAISGMALSAFVNKRYTAIPFYTLINYYSANSTIYYDPIPFVGPHPFLFVTTMGVPTTYAIYTTDSEPGVVKTLTRLGGTETITIPVWLGETYRTATTFDF